MPRPQRCRLSAGVAVGAALERVTSVRGPVDGAPAEVADESYRLEIATNGVRIVSPSAHGERLARVTLDQLVRLSDGQVDCCAIDDWPSLRVRGFMSDYGRNYQSKASILATLDLMAKYKYNLFHWHLTDSPAWRLESRRYPQLQASAAFSRQVGRFYTQDDFREVFAHAERLGIRVVPELDMPGHTAAFRRAFGLAKMNSPGVDSILCDLIDELCSLVPASRMPFIHIGTDEVVDVESVPSAWYDEWAEAVRRNGRMPLGWIPGHRIGTGGRAIEVVWGQHGKPNDPANPYLDTTKSYYLNHIDPFAVLFSAAYQRPCRWPGTTNRGLGAVLSYWHDVAAADDEQLMRDANVFPAIVLYADTFWHGRDADRPACWGRMPPVDDPAFGIAADLERRLMAQRRRVLGRTKYAFQYVPQTQMRWRITDFDGTVLARDVAQATVYPRHPLFQDVAHFQPSASSKGVWLETWIHSDVRRETGAWIGFTSFSRSHPRITPPAGRWNRYGAKVELNGHEVAPPDWRRPDRALDLETPFADEEYYMREPTRIVLAEGWNHVRLTVPRTKLANLDDCWGVTFMPVDGDSNHPEEVKGLVCRASPPAEEEAEPKAEVNRNR